MKHKINKISPAALLTGALVLLLGASAGYLGAMLADGMGLSGSVWFLLGGIILGLWVQILLHEGGHLVCGLAAGYGFVSFRVGSLMLMRRAGRLRLVRYRLPGTGGQCLLSPPPWREDGFPAMLYNLGGPAANLLASALCGAAAWLCRQAAPAAAAVRVGVAMMGLYLGLANGIPLKIGGMPNDGYNALCLRGDLAARRAIWAQRAINPAPMEGTPLRGLPAVWFALPGDAAPDDPLKGAVWVFRYSRLVDQGRYAEAAALRDELLKQGGRLAAVHRYALQADRAFFQLLEGETAPALEALDSRELKAFCRQMKGSPGIVLVQWAAASAAGKTGEAARLRAQLDKALAAWPYAGDAAATRELLALAEEKLCKSVTDPERKI